MLAHIDDRVRAWKRYELRCAFSKCVPADERTDLPRYIEWAYDVYLAECAAIGRTPRSYASLMAEASA